MVNSSGCSAYSTKATQACWNPQPSGVKGTTYPELWLQQNSALKMRRFLCSITGIVERTKLIPRAMQPWCLLFCSQARTGCHAIRADLSGQNHQHQMSINCCAYMHLPLCSTSVWERQTRSYGRRFRKLKDRQERAFTKHHVPRYRHCWCWHT